MEIYELLNRKTFRINNNREINTNSKLMMEFDSFNIGFYSFFFCFFFFLFLSEFQ